MPCFNVHVHVHVCVCVCVRACVRTRVCVCTRLVIDEVDTCICMCFTMLQASVSLYNYCEHLCLFDNLGICANLTTLQASVPLNNMDGDDTGICTSLTILCWSASMAKIYWARCSNPGTGNRSPAPNNPFYAPSSVSLPLPASPSPLSLTRALLLVGNLSQ